MMQQKVLLDIKLEETPQGEQAMRVSLGDDTTGLMPMNVGDIVAVTLNIELHPWQLFLDWLRGVR